MKSFKKHILQLLFQHCTTLLNCRCSTLPPSVYSGLKREAKQATVGETTGCHPPRPHRLRLCLISAPQRWWHLLLSLTQRDSNQSRPVKEGKVHCFEIWVEQLPECANTQVWAPHLFLSHCTCSSMTVSVHACLPTPRSRWGSERSHIISVQILPSASSGCLRWICLIFSKNKKAESLIWACRVLFSFFFIVLIHEHGRSVLPECVCSESPSLLVCVRSLSLSLSLSLSPSAVPQVDSTGWLI